MSNTNVPVLSIRRIIYYKMPPKNCVQIFNFMFCHSNDENGKGWNSKFVIIVDKRFIFDLNWFWGFDDFWDSEYREMSAYFWEIEYCYVLSTTESQNEMTLNKTKKLKFEAVPCRVN